MSYNHGKEEHKWQRWKQAEEKVLRACGMDESTIEQLRLWDRAMFNSDRRFYEKLQDSLLNVLYMVLNVRRKSTRYR
jgi:RNA polymerase sigma-70 factor (ECF subfamily)